MGADIMRVLFVEDSEHLQKPVATALKASGFVVDLASDGEEGVWQALNIEYDVIILDIMLPRLSGLEVLAKIRQSESSPPVLFLTARDEIEDRVNGLRAGADDYLTKPFAIDELLARVEALSRRRYGARTSIIELDDLAVDLSRKEVERAGRKVVLAPRQFALLEYLIMRKGEVVSRTDIEEHIYDEYQSPLSNVVDSAVCALRRSLQISPDAFPLIHTVRGHGYIMELRKS